MIDDAIDNFYNKEIEQYNSKEGIQDSNKAIRLAVDYETAKTGVTMISVLEKLIMDSKATGIEALILGVWEEAWEISAQPFIDFIAENSKILRNLKALFIGEMSAEENEISWIIQGNYQSIWKAYPNLELLQIRGGTSLNLGKIKHHNLKTLIIESGGLGKAVLNELAKGDLPELSHLELWLGSDEYGWDGTLDDVTPLLSKKKYPKLTHCAIMNSQIQGEIATAVFTSDLLESLKHIDLSMGVMVDKDVEQIFELKDKLVGKFIDVTENYLSEEMIKRLHQLDLNIDAADQDDEEDDDGFYVSVSE